MKKVLIATTILLVFQVEATHAQTHIEREEAYKNQAKPAHQEPISPISQSERDELMYYRDFMSSQASVPNNTLDAPRNQSQPSQPVSTRNNSYLTIKYNKGRENATMFWDDGYGEKGNGTISAVEFGLGYNGNKLRTEIAYTLFVTNDLEINYGFTQIKKNNSASTLLLNAYADIQTGSILTPYIGAGIGVAFIKIDYEMRNTWPNYSIEKIKDDNIVPALNLSVGLLLDMTESTSLDLGYRYIALAKEGYILTSDIYYDEKVNIERSFSMLNLGLHVKF